MYVWQLKTNVQRLILSQFESFLKVYCCTFFARTSKLNLRLVALDFFESLRLDCS